MKKCIIYLLAYLSPCLLFVNSIDPLTIKGINWFGLETENRMLGGLFVHDIQEHVTMMQEEGFNAIRIPFAMEGVLGGYYQHEMIIHDQTVYDILDEVFHECEKRNMYVLLDLHRLVFHNTHPLWHSSFRIESPYIRVPIMLTESNVLRGWKDIIVRFHNYGSFLGIDLYNEPHGVATFGTGLVSTDWKLFIENAYDELVPLLPSTAFMFVTGIQWGQNLQYFDMLDIRMKDRIVLSPHLYGPTLTMISNESWRSDPEILYYRWDHYFWYLSTDWILVIGEMGMNQYNGDDYLWMTFLVDYIVTHPMGWFYWAWNPDSKDVGGYLDYDWTTPIPMKKALLLELMYN